MRKAISVLALFLALTCCVYAGDMPNGSPEPPPPAPAEQEPTTDGTTHGDETDGLTETVLDLLARVLAAF